MENNTNRRIRIFDTTLRDGEQAPGASLYPEEKIRIARQLALMGIDTIEPGFPISSPGDFQAVQQISRELQGIEICGFARAVKADIDRCGQSHTRCRFETHSHVPVLVGHPSGFSAAQIPSTGRRDGSRHGRLCEAIRRSDRVFTDGRNANRRRIPVSKCSKLSLLKAQQYSTSLTR